MESILDRYKLETEEGKEKFEGCIAVGITKGQLLVAFRKTQAEMNQWCLNTYGMSFDNVYEAVKMGAIGEFLDCVNALGMRGNPSALGIINEALRGANNTGTVKIVFENNVDEENEDDKKNDEEEHN
jgi:hypothetical protein